MPSVPWRFGESIRQGRAYAEIGEPVRAWRSLQEARRTSPELSDESLKRIMGEALWRKIISVADEGKIALGQ